MLLIRRITRGRAATLALAFFALLVLSGCRASVDVVARVQEDGSGTVEATATLDAQTAAALLDLDLDTSGMPLSDLSQAGWVVQAPVVDGAGNTVIKASKEFGTPEQFAEVMAELSGSGPESGGVYRGFTLTRTRRFARVDFELAGQLDTSQGLDSFSDPELDAALGRKVSAIAADPYGVDPRTIAVSFDVVLPGTLQSSSPGGVVKEGEDTTEVAWQSTMADGDTTDLALVSVTRQVVPRALRGLAVLTGVLAVLILFARILRIVLPDRRRRPPRRHTSSIRPLDPRAATLNQEPPVQLPPPGEDGHGWVVVDGMGVLFRETDPVENLLIPFARQHGSPRTDTEILARARALRLGRMTTGELWASLGVAGDPEELDSAYLAHHQLSPGVIRYLRSLREQGVRLACIADDAATWNSRLRVSHSLETLIELWVVSGSVGAVKPDRSLYEVLRRFAQEPPSRILVIDDDRAMLDAARAMGYATAWFTSTGTRAEAGDHQVIRSFEGAADDLVDDRL